MQYKEVAGGICAPKGFAAAGVHCGIRANHNEKYDLALIKAEVRCAAAGVYTTNKVCGAPIKVDRAHLKDGYAQAILVNSGNANTCAANGVALAEECCELVGKELGIDPQDVLPASTGVIGQPMVIDPFARGIPAAAEKLAADFGLSATENFPRQHLKIVEYKDPIQILYECRAILADWRIRFVPKLSEEELHPCFVASLHYTDYIQYLIENRHFLTEHRKEVQQIAQRIRKYEIDHFQHPQNALAG